MKCDGTQDPSCRSGIRTTWRAICDWMLGIEADMTVLRAFQVPSTRGNTREGKDKTKSCSRPRPEGIDREVTVTDPLTPTLDGG